MDVYNNQTNCKSSIDASLFPLSSPSRPVMKRRQSSSQTVVSNTSSIRSHRRSSVEVGSMIFSAPASSLQSTDSSYREEPEPIKQRMNIYRSQSLEHRAPEENSNASSCLPAVVSKDSDTICCTASKEDDETERVFDLIKLLSFETGDVSLSKKSNASVCSAPTVLMPPAVLTSFAAEQNNFSPEGQDEADFQPESPRLALPPKIHRMQDSHSVISVPDHVPQIMHSRNRLRSTSLSEMSDSCRLAYGREDEQVDASSLHSFGPSSTKSNEDELVLNTIDNTVISPPLYPGSAPHAPPVMNRGRTSTMTSDNSSFLSSSSSSSNGLSEEYSISNYDHELHGLDDHPAYHGDCNSEPWHRDAMTGGARTHLSWDHRVSNPHHLSSEALQRWNKFCEEEELTEGVATKHQHIWRALSYPDIRACAGAENKARDQMEDIPTHLMIGETEDEEEIPVMPDVLPHLMADELPISHAPSRSIFSYTNSYSPSTISSGLSETDEISHLDFDMSILYPREIEVINSPDTADTVALRRKRLHRRCRSSMSLSIPSNAQMHFRTNQRHRRNKSDYVCTSQAVDSNATPPTKHHKLLSLTNIIEDVKSLRSASIANSSDRKLSNIPPLPFTSDDVNVLSMKDSVLKAWEYHGEKICWFTIGCCFAASMQHFRLH